MKMMRNFYLRLVNYFLLLLLLPALGLAVNPFEPPEQIILFQEILSQSDENLPEYSMYIYRSEVMYALLNDAFVKEGDTFEGMDVQTVSDKAVILKTPEGHKKVIVIKSLQGEVDELKQIVNKVRQ